MRLTFRTTSSEVDPPITVTVTGPTPLQCLGLVEAELQSLLVPETTLGDDPAFDVTAALGKLENGEKYTRLDFSTPEENFELVPAADDPAADPTAAKIETVKAALDALADTSSTPSRLHVVAWCARDEGNRDPDSNTDVYTRLAMLTDEQAKAVRADLADRHNVLGHDVAPAFSEKIVDFTALSQTIVDTTDDDDEDGGDGDRT